MGTGDVKFYVIVDVPFVLLYTIIFTAFQLNLLYIFISSKSVDGLATMSADGREKRFFLEHGCLVLDILIDVLQTVVAHASEQEPGADIFVSGDVGCTDSSTVHVD